MTPVAKAKNGNSQLFQAGSAAEGVRPVGDHQLTFFYDAWDRLHTVTDPLGPAVQFIVPHKRAVAG